MCILDPSIFYAPREKEIATAFSGCDLLLLFFLLLLNHKTPFASSLDSNFFLLVCLSFDDHTRAFHVMFSCLHYIFLMDVFFVVFVELGAAQQWKHFNSAGRPDDVDQQFARWTRAASSSPAPSRADLWPRQCRTHFAQASIRPSGNLPPLMSF